MRDSLSGTRGLCPFCNAAIEVPQVTVAVRAERVKQVVSPPAPAPPVFVDAPPARPAAPSNNGGETTIYSDSDVTVTTSQVLCGGTAYALRSITSVRMRETHPNAIPTLVAMALGLCVLVAALARLEFNAGVVFLFVVGIALIAFGVRHVHQLTPDYHLLISSSSGEVRAFTSKDRQQVEQTVAAVNEAIIRYR
jgi:hypothetical protein